MVFRRGSGFYSMLRLEGFGEVFGVFTNNHVLGSLSEAENAYATFGYEGSSGGQKIKLRPEVIFRTHRVSIACDRSLISLNLILSLVCISAMLGSKTIEIKIEFYSQRMTISLFSPQHGRDRFQTALLRTD